MDDAGFGQPLAALRWSAPLQWLAAGWRDFTHAPLIGLFYGACFVGMGWMLLWVFQFAAAYTLALSAGFLLLGPFLCLGLYQASRALAQGKQPRLLDTMTAWRGNGGTMAIFGFILLIIEMLWGRSAMVIFAVSFDAVPQFNGTLTQLLAPEYMTFVVTYLGIGAFFASLIYAIGVISIPMILDQSTDAISAGLTSIRLVLTQPGVMLMWAAMIATIVFVAMLPGFLGLLIAGPVLGHASWHAYKAATAAMS